MIASVVFHCSITHPSAHVVHFGLMLAVPAVFGLTLSRVRARPADDDARRARLLSSIGMRSR